MSRFSLRWWMGALGAAAAVLTCVRVPLAAAAGPLDSYKCYKAKDL